MKIIGAVKPENLNSTLWIWKVEIAERCVMCSKVVQILSLLSSLIVEDGDQGYCCSCRIQMWKKISWDDPKKLLGQFIEIVGPIELLESE